MNIKDIHSIFFFGIGGIGVSALARYFHAEGIAIYGYDKVQTPLTQELETMGMTIHYEDNLELLHKTADLYIRTVAVKPSELGELDYILDRGDKVWLRAEVLGLISKQKNCIAIAGTHGKTSTASLLTHILKSGGLDITAFVGGIMNNYQTNYIQGTADWVVVEADEFNKSFLELYPEILIVNSMDADHLDIYTGGLSEMHATYNQLVSQVTNGGLVIHKEGLPVSTPNNLQSVAFGTSNGAVQCNNIKVVNGVFHFDYKSDEHTIADIKCTFPGEHNILNATAAITVALQLGVTSEAIKGALASFKGIQRRFEFVEQSDDFVFIDDYAHHPEELKAAISATKKLYPHQKITGVFQPHLFTRTRDFLEGFAESLSLLDEVYLLPIYPAREQPIEGVVSERIAELIKEVPVEVVSKGAFIEKMQESKPSVLLTLGAGDIGLEVLKLKRLFNAKTSIS